METTSTPSAPAKVAQHTPGPWNVEVFCVWSGDTLVAATKTGLHREEQAANARLIAAAPELLAALRNVIEADLRSGRYDELADKSVRQGGELDGADAAYLASIEQARAVIAKAEGATT